MICVIVEKDIKLLHVPVEVKYESEGFPFTDKEGIFYPTHILYEIFKSAEIKMFEFHSKKEFDSTMNTLFGMHWVQCGTISYNGVYGTATNKNINKTYEFYTFDLSDINEIELSTLPHLRIDVKPGC